MTVTTFDRRFDCDHCGRICGNYEGGYGSVTVNNTRLVLCHPNVPYRPDCYTLVTLYHEPIGVRKNGN